MRPRLFAAENKRPRRHAYEKLRASMRPRLFAAENVRFAFHEERHALASMRPRLFAAENGMTRTYKRADLRLQ